MHDFAHSAEDDRELLAAFAAGERDAFGALVERYSGLVYGTAMRRLADEEWAADTAQNVFAALAVKAPALVEGGVPSVGAWLHRATVFESKRVLRDRLNQRKREAMIRDELTRASGDGGADETVWADLRPELDEALQRLSARDRDVLVLYYFDGLKFKEIAARLGMRADAAQKRGKRALEKLARTLGARRGVTVSTAVLAAGLAPELSSAAPAALVSKLVTTKAATSSAAVISAMTTAATKTTATTVALALALFAASIGSGYVIGEKTKPPPNPIVDSSPVERGGQSNTEIAGATASVAAIPVDDGDSATEKFLAVVRALMAEREQIAKQGRPLLKGGSEVEIDRLFAAFEAIELRGIEAAGALPLEELEEALANLGSEPSPDTRSLAGQFLLTSWGQRDPDGALAANGGSASGAVSVFRGFAMRDAASALQRWRELGRDDRSLVRSALGGVFQGWLVSAPAAAIRALEQLEFDEQKVAFGTLKNVHRRPSIRRPVLDAVAAVGDEKTRADLVLHVGARWAEYMPRAAFSWFDSIRFENPRLALPAARAMFGNATKNGYSAEAIDWIWGLLPVDQKADFFRSEISGAWTREDSEAAAAWMAENGITEGATP